MDAERSAPAGAAKFVFLAVLLFVLAVVEARLILTGTWGWAVAAASLPIVLIVLRLLLGWPGAFLLAAFFAAAVFALRAVLENPKIGPAYVLLVGAFAISALLAARVVMGLFLMKRESTMERESQKEAGKEEREGRGN